MRGKWFDRFLEVGIWVLFAVLLVPAGVVGYAIGRGDHSSATRTVTVAGSGTTAAETTAEQTTTEPATTASTTTAPTTTEPTTTGSTTNQGSTGNAAAGRSIFASNCSPCHGPTGHGGSGGPDLTSIPSAKNYDRVLAQVTNGGGGMPPFKGTLSEQQIRDVATYVTKNITGGA